MKLTKGKIKKYLLKDKQSRKKYTNACKNTDTCKSTNTCKNKKGFNLKNKTIKL